MMKRLQMSVTVSGLHRSDLAILGVTSPFSVAAVSEQKDACSSEDASAVNTFFEVCFVVGAFSFGQVHPHGLCHG